MPRIHLELSEEEKRQLEVAKMLSPHSNWRDLFLELAEKEYNPAQKLETMREGGE